MNRKMISNKFGRYVCCTKDVTLAARAIAFVGIAVSVMLVTTLLNDLSAKNFEISRKITLILGLDWRHLHPLASTSAKVDPEGKIIYAVVIVYSIVFFLTNVLLFYAAIQEKPNLAIPWLICEFIGCLSKLIGLIFHVVTGGNDLNQIFIVGSSIYLIIMIWWWLVVRAALLTWHQKAQATLELSTFFYETKDAFNSTLDSMQSYNLNGSYATI